MDIVMELSEEQKKGIAAADDVKVDFIHHTAKILRALADKIDAEKEVPTEASLLMSKDQYGVCRYTITTLYKGE